MKWTLGWIWLSQVVLWLLTITAICCPALGWYALAGWLLKFFSDRLVLTEVSRFFQKGHIGCWLLPTVPLHSLYIVLVGLAGIFGIRGRWK